jgi:hypothetical protein
MLISRIAVIFDSFSEYRSKVLLLYFLFLRCQLIIIFSVQIRLKRDFEKLIKIANDEKIRKQNISSYKKILTSWGILTHTLSLFVLIIFINILFSFFQGYYF